jgi:hypothetical protein
MCDAAVTNNRRGWPVRVRNLRRAARLTPAPSHHTGGQHRPGPRPHGDPVAFIRCGVQLHGWPRDGDALLNACSSAKPWRICADGPTADVLSTLREFRGVVTLLK